MWGTSFNDLAKKAAEMQEQAAASITSPNASGFSMGSMFNMDTLQQDDESNPKGDELKRLAHQRADTLTSSSASGIAFKNPLAAGQSNTNHISGNGNNIIHNGGYHPQQQQPPSSTMHVQQPKSAMPAVTITPNNMTSALSFGSSSNSSNIINNSYKPATAKTATTNPATARMTNANMNANKGGSDPFQSLAMASTAFLGSKISTTEASPSVAVAAAVPAAAFKGKPTNPKPSVPSKQLAPSKPLTTAGTTTTRTPAKTTPGSIGAASAGASTKFNNAAQTMNNNNKKSNATSMQQQKQQQQQEQLSRHARTLLGRHGDGTYRLPGCLEIVRKKFVPTGVISTELRYWRRRSSHVGPEYKGQQK
mmetsp:Transcript_2560/g.5236  ORF Transcript_2560/g.5236 Transcript_2560/m.5236 type:complete len:364 (+) Transcript_2560:134-1225(+)